mmetsp:Transcript_52252/g.137990  ORF Transcript_52252/g.137990 Transcript_52252/m.137990 type:complete len:128 (-) Transcript_52252:260-643(-)
MSSLASSSLFSVLALENVQAGDAPPKPAPRKAPRRAAGKQASEQRRGPCRTTSARSSMFDILALESSTLTSTAQLRFAWEAKQRNLRAQQAGLANLIRSKEYIEPWSNELGQHRGVMDMLPMQVRGA